MSEVNDTLYSLLEELELLDGNTVRGTSMSGNIEDGLLHFLVNYNVFLRVVIEDNEMEEYTTNEKTI